MICKALPYATRRDLEDTIERLSEKVATDTARFVQRGEMNLAQFGEIIATATEVGKLTAIRDHDNICVATPRAQTIRGPVY